MTKGEGNAVLLLFFCTLLITLWPYRPIREQSTDVHKLLALSDSLDEQKNHVSVRTDQIRKFSFNPNTASVDQLIDLGFKKYIANRIYNYRVKVKPFQYKEDLLKIFGIDTSKVINLYSYILLPVRPMESGKRTFEKMEPLQQTSIFPVELNSSDSILLEKLPCIGAKLAKRITVFREKLGGFVLKDQLKEVYGIDTSCLKEIFSKTTLNSDLVKKIRINIDGYEILSKHPYIGRSLAKGLLAFRDQHGPFRNEYDMLKLKSITKDKLSGLLPYMDFSEQ